MSDRRRQRLMVDKPWLAAPFARQPQPGSRAAEERREKALWGAADAVSPSNPEAKVEDEERRD